LEQSVFFKKTVDRSWNNDSRFFEIFSKLFDFRMLGFRAIFVWSVDENP